MKRRKELSMAKVLKMKSGKKYKILDENGKYYICEHTQFRKANPDILAVEEVEDKPKAVQKKKAAVKKTVKEKKGE